MTIYTCMISIYIYKGQKLIKDNYLRLRDVPTLMKGRTLSLTKPLHIIKLVANTTTTHIAEQVLLVTNDINIE